MVRPPCSARLVGEVHMNSGLFGETVPRLTLGTRLVVEVHMNSGWFDANEPTCNTKNKAFG